MKGSGKYIYDLLETCSRGRMLVWLCRRLNTTIASKQISLREGQAAEGLGERKNAATLSSEGPRQNKVDQRWIFKGNLLRA